MREDPIIREDWETGIASKYSLRHLATVDYLLSLMILAVVVVLGVLNRIGFILFLSTFAIIGLTVLEIFVEAKSRSLSDRIFVVLTLILLIFFMPLDLSDNFFSQLLLVIFLSAKITIIPLIVSNNSFTEEILVPKTDAVHLVLKDHVDRLRNTEFALEDEDQIRKSFLELFYSNLRIFILPLIMGLVVYLSSLVLAEIVTFYIIFGLYFIGSLSFLLLAITWYRSNRLDKQAKTVQT